MHNQKGFAPILILVGILAIIAVAGGAYYFGKSQNPKPQPQATTTPSSIPDASREPNGSAETANWKTYTGMTSKNNGHQGQISIKYPPQWLLQGSILYPFAENKDIFVLLGDGPRGGLALSDTKTFPAGVAIYEWIEMPESSGRIWGRADFLINSISYNFGVEGLPIKYSEEYQKIFNQILSTFKFIP